MTARDDLFAAIDAGDHPRLAGMLSAEPRLAAERGPDGISAALHARYRADHTAVELLLHSNPPLDVFDAAAFGRIGRLAELLDGDPGLVAARSPDGFTPLHLAAFFGQLESTRLLLERDAPVDAVADNEMRVTPLHSATAGGHEDVARLLIKAGADVNARQRHGYTPLHGAAQNGQVDLVDVLLEAGADPAARTDDGRTPADLAREAGRPALAARLEKAAADRVAKDSG
jgi:ankyrin repeat protein